MQATYIISAKALDGRAMYFDGFGWTLLRSSALTMNASDGIGRRTSLCREFPACQLEHAQ